MKAFRIGMVNDSTERLSKKPRIAPEGKEGDGVRGRGGGRGMGRGRGGGRDGGSATPVGGLRRQINPWKADNWEQLEALNLDIGQIAPELDSFSSFSTSSMFSPPNTVETVVLLDFDTEAANERRVPEKSGDKRLTLPPFTIDDFVQFLLFYDLPPSLLVLVCKSTYVPLSCFSCSTNLGKLTPTEQRVLLQKHHNHPKGMSVLNFYSYWVSKLFPSSKLIVLSDDERRVEAVQDELKKKGLKLHHSNLTGHIKLNIFPTDLRQLFLSTTATTMQPLLDFIDNLQPDLSSHHNLTLNQLEPETTKEITTNALFWMRHLKKTNQLPKTLPKLQNALKKLSYAKYTADGETVACQLLKEGHINLCSKCHSIFYPKHSNPPTEIPSSSSSFSYSSSSTPSSLTDSDGTILQQVTQQIIKWITSVPSSALPTAIEGLLNHIGTIQIKHFIEPAEIIRSMLSEKLIAVEVKERKDYFSAPEEIVKYIAIDTVEQD